MLNATEFRELCDKKGGIPAAYAAMMERPLWGELMKRYIPKELHMEISMWILYGQTPASLYLKAILANDLVTACNLTKKEDRVKLCNYVIFMNNAMPRQSYGSARIVRKWALAGGYVGRTWGR